jgi:hypothetical protein
MSQRQIRSVQPFDSIKEKSQVRQESLYSEERKRKKGIMKEITGWQKMTKKPR